MATASPRVRVSAADLGLEILPRARRSLDREPLREVRLLPGDPASQDNAGAITASVGLAAIGADGTGARVTASRLASRWAASARRTITATRTTTMTATPMRRTRMLATINTLSLRPARMQRPTARSATGLMIQRLAPISVMMENGTPARNLFRSINLYLISGAVLQRGTAPEAPESAKRLSLSEWVPHPAASRHRVIDAGLE